MGLAATGGAVGELGLSLKMAASSLLCRRFWLTMIGLAVVDSLLIILHLLWSRGITIQISGATVSFGDSRWLNIGQERGYAEMKELAAATVAVVLLGSAWLRDRQPILLALAAISVLVIGDNLFQFHEKIGVFLARAIEADESSLSRHGGEVAGFALLGLLILFLFVAAYRRSSPGIRPHALIGICIVALLGAFAMGVDALHALASQVMAPPPGLENLLTLIEDGGETISISLLLAFAVGLHRHVLESTPRR